MRNTIAVLLSLSVVLGLGCKDSPSSGSPGAAPSGSAVGSAPSPPPSAHALAPSGTSSGMASSSAAHDDSGALVLALKTAKHTLLEAIQQAEKDNGPAISAKLELEDGKLNISVYTAKQGLGKDAEHNTLMELSGDATADKWTPKSEVFEDKEHISRASMHLTLVQRAKTTLSAVIAKAAAQQPGIIYSVIPAVKNKRPVFDVLVASPEGKSVALTIEG